MAEVEKQMADPNGPLSTIGFTRYALAFDDQGLMPKLEPQLAQMRPMMLGTNPDGTPKTEMSEEDLKTAAGQMAAGGKMPPEKLLPVVKAFYTFVMTPDVIKIAVNLDPALTMPEMQQMSNMSEKTGGVDWASRVTFEASN